MERLGQSFGKSSGFSGLVLSEASCLSVVMTARAAIKDNPDAATLPLRELAALRDKDAERGAHAIFKKCGLTLPFGIHYVDVGPQGLQKFPCLRFSDWLRYLMDTGRYHLMTGSPNLEHMMERLREFWRRFAEIKMFQEGRVIPSLCLPVLSHTDEGRTYRKKAIMVVSTAPGTWHHCIH